MTMMVLVLLILSFFSQSEAAPKKQIITINNHNHYCELDDDVLSCQYQGIADYVLTDTDRETQGVLAVNFDRMFSPSTLSVPDGVVVTLSEGDCEAVLSTISFVNGKACVGIPPLKYKIHTLYQQNIQHIFIHDTINLHM